MVLKASEKSSLKRERVSVSALAFLYWLTIRRDEEFHW